MSKIHCAAQHRFPPDCTSAMMAPYLIMNNVVESLAFGGLLIRFRAHHSNWSSYSTGINNRNEKVLYLFLPGLFSVLLVEFLPDSSHRSGSVCLKSLFESHSVTATTRHRQQHTLGSLRRMSPLRCCFRALRSRSKIVLFAARFPDWLVPGGASRGKVFAVVMVGGCWIAGTQSLVIYSTVTALR